MARRMNSMKTVDDPELSDYVNIEGEMSDHNGRGFAPLYMFWYCLLRRLVDSFSSQPPASCQIVQYEA